MGIQFNYFAASEDLNLIAKLIIEWSPDLTKLPERGIYGNLGEMKIRCANDLIPGTSGEMHYLCPSEFISEIATTPVDSQISCIRVASNPVLEYSPSAPINPETVKIGRFYSSFDNTDFVRRVKQLIQSLKTHSTKIGNSDIWIFPDAAKSAKMLRPWVGKDWNNNN